MARILIAVSSIGLGHAARSRLLGALLESSGHEIYYYAPGRAGWYIEAWGGSVVEESRSASDLSIIAETWYEKTGTALIGLRAALEEHKVALGNAAGLLRVVARLSPDVVVADESWEAISVSEKLPSPKAWIADFPLYPPLGNPARIAAAVAVNRFLLRRLPHFDILAYVGLPWSAERLRAYKIAGPRLGEVLSWFEQIGPIPPLSTSEALPRREARRLLGLPDDGRVVLVQPGGTRIGEELLPDPDDESLVYRVEARDPRLPRLLKAFDCVYSHAGLSTIAGLALLGVPGVLRPLPDHFEQEHNAETAPKIWPWIALHPARCPAPGPGDPSLESNAWRLAELVSELATA